MDEEREVLLLKKRGIKRRCVFPEERRDVEREVLHLKRRGLGWGGVFLQKGRGMRRGRCCSGRKEVSGGECVAPEEHRDEKREVLVLKRRGIRRGVCFSRREEG